MSDQDMQGGSAEKSSSHLASRSSATAFHVIAALPSNRVSRSKLRIGDLSAEVQPVLDAEEEEEADVDAVGPIEHAWHVLPAAS